MCTPPIPTLVDCRKINLLIFFFFSLLFLVSCSPNMANTVNAALKPLETLSRIVNQPSSLFGGKGGSSKSKTEHDAVGTVRDSNSNTQDPGNAKMFQCVDHFNLHHSMVTVALPNFVCVMAGIVYRRGRRGRASRES